MITGIVSGLATGGIIAIFYAGIVAFVGMLTSLLSSASIHVANVMLGTTFFNYEGNENIFSVLENLFGSGGIGNFGDFNIAHVVQITALSLTVIITAVSVIESWMMSLQGEKSDNPVKILLRGVFAVILQFVLFGINISDNNAWFNTTGLVYAFGDGLSELMAMFTKNLGDASKALSAWSVGINFDVPVQIVVLMLSFAIFKGVVEAAVVFVERWLSTAVYILFGPLACSCYASGKMKQSFSRWMIGVLTQFLTIFVTVFAWRLFISSMASLPEFYVGFGNSESGITPGGIETVNVVLQNAIALASLSLVKNSEKIINALGLQTIMTGQTAGEFARGAQTFARNITDPFIRPLQQNFGRNVVNTATRAAYNTAVAKRGADSQTAHLLSNFMDPTEKILQRAGIMEDGAKAIQNENGDYRLKEPTAKEMAKRSKYQDVNPTKLNEYKTATHNINSALDGGVGTTFSMRDGVKVIGNNKATEGIKVGAEGISAKTGHGIDGFVYSEQHQNKRGLGGWSESSMKFVSPVELDKGESINLSSNGDSGLRIKTENVKRNSGGLYVYDVEDISSWSREQYVESKMGSTNMEQLSKVYDSAGGNRYDSSASTLKYLNENPDAPKLDTKQIDDYFKYANEWQDIQNNVKEVSEIKSNLTHQQHYDSYNIPELNNANAALNKGFFDKQNQFVDGDKILEDATKK